MIPTILMLGLGCAYEEVLPEKDISGTVIVPRSAATALLPSGEEVVDPRLIGPVFLGAYSGMDNTSFSYPHPSMGPIVTADTPGDAFPYGGTTVGRFDFACYEALACKVVTGRFDSYTSVLEYFEMIGNPIHDQNGNPVESGSAFQQACYDYYFATSDAEMAFIGTPDFVENADGDFEASFSMPHTVYVDGLTVWGWMDSPQVDLANPANSGNFSTCDVTAAGREQDEYDENFYEGRVYSDALNLPSQYVFDGDWVSQGTADEVVTLVDDGSGTMVPTNPVVRLDFGVGVEE